MKINVLIGIYFVFISSFGTSCKEKSPENLNAETPKVKTELPYPLLPQLEFEYLYQNAEAVDYIFHNLPFSVNQTDRPSVRNTISGFTKDEVYQSNCQSLGRMFIQVQGNIVMEAEIYYDLQNGCHHFIFYKDKKAVYFAGMTNEAINFYQTLINNAQAQE